jgi:hypothetical protein
VAKSSNELEYFNIQELITITSLLSIHYKKLEAAVIQDPGALGCNTKLQVSISHHFEHKPSNTASYPRSPGSSTTSP